MTNARHTIVLRALGTKPAVSRGTWVRLDTFTAGAARYEESSPAVRMQFSRLLSSLALGGGAARQAHVVAGDNGSAPTYTFAFRGTGFTWYGARGPWSGKASVTIDGVHRGTVDTWAARTAYRSTVWSSPALLNRQHTVRITVLGAQRSGAAGNHVSLDNITLR